MKCGAKRFLAEVNINGVKQTKPVIARTPAAARRVIRKNYGADTEIISVREERKNRNA